MDKRAIGVFDSGLGGLTVVKEIRKILPNESIIYLGDTARVPYGTRSKEVVTRFSLEDAKFLLKENVKCIVVACNTASALSFDSLNKVIKIPIFEVITPASIKVARITKTKRVGVIGTWGTITSGAYEKKIKKEDRNVEVFSQACPLLVPLIEENEMDPKVLKAIIQKYLAELKRKNVDTLILGCTHYPIIKNAIERYLGSGVALINPGREVAVSLADYLVKKGLNSPKKLHPVRKYYVTDLTERFIEVARMFLQDNLDGKIIKVEIN
ncbi:MAG: glutamate racemase [Patescibacteria group bacterium]